MIAAAPQDPSSVSVGLNAGNFRRVARNGIADSHNSYPHAMTWFRDHLYVSTTRDNLVLMKLRYPFDVAMACWPVPLPGSVWDLDLRAQIWRYDPRTDQWARVYISPTKVGRRGFAVPVAVAFRSMQVFQGASDPEPVLYLPTFAPSELPEGAVMLRSSDGETYEVVSEASFGVGRWAFRSFRALVPFKDWLFVAPAMGVDPGKPNTAGVAVVLASRDPRGGQWHIACDPNFGNPRNLTVFEMAACNGFLYAGTFNHEEGMEVWKTDAEGEPPFRWHRVLAQGAHRGRLNEGPASMAAFKGHLYVGTGIQNGGYDRINKVGPAAPELIRIAPDDSWDLIAGEPRATPVGVKVPLSGMGPGFHNPFTGYFWEMCEHDGWLYVGTFDVSVFLPYATLDAVPEWLRNIIDRVGRDTFVQRFGGFDLWRSEDGARWVPVCRNGFGNRFNYGARTMASTPYGLFVGATNPFGPDVAVRRAGGWRFEPNPDGGLEVWLGSAGTPEDAVRHAPGLATVHPSDVTVFLDEALASDMGSSRPDVCRQWVEEFYSGSGYWQVGFWRNDIHDAATACDNLMEELLSFLPDTVGSVLDVAGGTAGTTRYLVRARPGARVVAACRTAEEARAGHALVPAARFTATPLPWLRFPDGAFEHVVCVEHLAYEGRRRRLLGELRRVVRPGGRVVLADLLFDDEAGRGPGDPVPTDAKSYEALLASLGFVDITVLDATTSCWERFYGHASRYFSVLVLAQEIDGSLLDDIRLALPGRGQPVHRYLIAAATSPS